MNAKLRELTSFIQSFASKHKGCSKKQITEAVKESFGLIKSRSVYHCKEYAIRFSKASGSSFSNTVVSLSALKKYDDRPFIVCVVRPIEIELLLANSTFLKKISHSSQQLRVDNIRGSFNGTDIIREYSGIVNTFENFDKLFRIHREFTWSENLLRLVEETNSIVPTIALFKPSREQRDKILSAPYIAKSLSNNVEYLQLNNELSELIQDKKYEIIQAARVDNVKLRGDKIEQLVSGAASLHTLEDISRKLSNGIQVHIDIKTKILTLSSNPKGYNIDKMLRVLACGNVSLSFLFIGINVKDESVSSRLVSILDSTILNSTRIQFHWAGRKSRGVTQLSGDLKSIFSNDFSEEINEPSAITFLEDLIDRRSQ